MQKDINLRIFFDNEITPSVDARLCDFFIQSEFGLDLPNHSTVGRALPVGLDQDNQLYCYFPMPFQKAARIELVSNRNVPTKDITYEIQYKSFTAPFSSVGYFKTAHVYANVTEDDNKNITLLNVKGSGKLVGVSANMMQDVLNAINNASFLEGDERIYVDGSNTSAICGSGKEDFFGGSYYFWGGPASLPYSGCIFNSKWGYNSESGTFKPYKSSAYRLMINDAVSFRSEIKLDIEHGSHFGYNKWSGEERDAPNHDQEKSHYLTYYYLNPDVAMSLSDTLETGNSISQKKHLYNIDNKTQVTKTGNWDRNGYYDQENHTSTGMALTGGGESAFTMTIHPKNSGCMLRRLMWYADANQEAEVYVDGEKVGIWFEGGKNFQKETDIKPMLWRDSQYFIPAKFVQSKSSIKIKLKVISNVWNEYKYEIFSMKEMEKINEVLNR